MAFLKKLGSLIKSVFGGGKSKTAPKTGTSGTLRDFPDDRLAAAHRRQQEQAELTRRNLDKAVAEIGKAADRQIADMRREREERKAAWDKREREFRERERELDAIGRENLSELERYLAGDLWVSGFKSSNVNSFAYDPGQKTLLIIFNDGNEYHYLNVSVQEAESLYRAGSKGGWVWDNLRIRKTRLGHKKQYIHVGGHTYVRRKWIQTTERIQAHLGQVGQQSAAKGYHGVFGVVPESVPDRRVFATPVRKDGESWLKERVGPKGGPFGRR